MNTKEKQQARQELKESLFKHLDMVWDKLSRERVPINNNIKDQIWRIVQYELNKARASAYIRGMKKGRNDEIVFLIKKHLSKREPDIK